MPRLFVDCEEDPKKIDMNYLEQFPEVIEFLQRKKGKEKSEVSPKVLELEANQEETLETAC